MADEKNEKKEPKEEQKPADDLFGEMDDVIGERKEAAPKPEPEKKEEVKAEEKKPSAHTRISPNKPATTASAKAELNEIWLTAKDGKVYTIYEISPEDFAWWCNDKLPGLRKVEASGVQTPQQRVDIFNEVIHILEHWHRISLTSRNKNLY